MPWVRRLDQADFARTVAGARLVVAHAGMGSVITADEFGKPIVILPRLQDRGEHTTDHQVATAAWLRGKPGIHVADRDEDLGPRIAEALAARRRRRPRFAPRRQPGVPRPHPSVHPELGGFHGQDRRRGARQDGAVALRHRQLASRRRRSRSATPRRWCSTCVGRYTGVPVFRDYDAMLAAGLDAVIVATPSRLHGPMVRTALERGHPRLLREALLPRLARIRGARRARRPRRASSTRSATTTATPAPSAR